MSNLYEKVGKAHDVVVALNISNKDKYIPSRAYAFMGKHESVHVLIKDKSNGEILGSKEADPTWLYKVTWKVNQDVEDIRFYKWELVEPNRYLEPDGESKYKWVEIV